MKRALLLLLALPACTPTMQARVRSAADISLEVCRAVLAANPARADRLGVACRVAVKLDNAARP